MSRKWTETLTPSTEMVVIGCVDGAGELADGDVEDSPLDAPA
jgi:hypothetical protein